MQAGVKIYIHTEFKDSPWGGGNQFLKALRNEFKKKECSADQPEDADVILFNSHQLLSDIINLKRKFPEKIFMHRVDGPMSYRGKSGKITDKIIFSVNRLLADGTIFQSNWSREESYRQGMLENNFETVMHNAPDPTIFFPKDQQMKIGGMVKGKINLIATSWSDNPEKGFDVYHYLDKNLDFDRYEMTFVGRYDSPFENIKMTEPVPSKKVAEYLRQHDIFIFASKLEACSNSLLETLHCGLPAVVRNTSSNPEILSKGGNVFEGTEDILEKIDIVAENIDGYRKKTKVVSIEEIGKMYYQFCERICNDAYRGKYKIKRLNYLNYVKLKMSLI